MVDTNQDPVQTEESVKKKKASPKKTVSKDKVQDKPVVKKLPVKKEGGTPAKSQPAAKAPAAPRKQTLTMIKKFLKGALSELKKVHWPSRQELIAYTGVVLVAVTFVAILLFAVDSILSRVLQFIIPK
ncbi:MAG: preprotein translocase subunit SecE [Eubacteriales bacterium]